MVKWLGNLMATPNIFIFTAGNAEAREHLNVSITNPLNVEAVISHFPQQDAVRIRELAEDGGLYAWGATPGVRNNPNWEAMTPGDWVLCVFGNHYRYAARVLAKYDNKSLALATWGADPSGETWQLMYFLSKPIAVKIPVGNLATELSGGYRGFTRISDQKVARIADEFGSVDDFMDQEVLANEHVGTGGVPDGITRDDVLQAIRDYDTGERGDFGESTFYDLLFDDKRYPPKVICGLAARRILGRKLHHYEFSGGKSSKCFRVLTGHGFEIVDKEKGSASYLLIRSNEVSPYNDEEGAVYHFTSHVPNHKKLLEGAMVVVDSKSAKGVMLTGFGVLEAAQEINHPKEGPVEYKCAFSEWTPFESAHAIPDAVLAQIKALPSYNAQHAIRVINSDLYEKLTEQGRELCLLGTWPSIEADFDRVSDFIEEHGAFASWWSFVIGEDVGKALEAPFQIYLNTGGGRFPVRMEVAEFVTSRGSEGIESPWPEQTYPEWQHRNRAGSKQSEIFKTWLKVTKIERLPSSLAIDDFEPASPWSHEKSVLNQNAFGFAYLRSPMRTPPRMVEESFSIDDALNLLFMPREDLVDILGGLRRKKNIILEGPPGVGKTYAARLIAYTLMNAKGDSRIEMVQFHQSYAYEDFIQGWRPTASGGFELKSGVFYQFCNKARQHPDQTFVFIIDEINRGNISKILGELMMLIEHDKRGSKFAIPLTYSQNNSERFYIPENLYLIGMMNTADRSLAMVDYALRRRFSFYRLRPQLDSSGFKALLENKGASEELIQKIRSRMRAVNSEIETNPHLGWGFEIGHSYFCDALEESVDDSWFDAIIRTEIAPQIREYWFDQPEKAESLIEEIRE